MKLHRRVSHEDEKPRPYSAGSSASEPLPSTSIPAPAALPQQDRKPGGAARALTDKIILEIENGTAPWCKPWSSPLYLPMNGQSGNHYRGANVLNLMSADYQDPRWCTFNQAKKQGWHVRKGEKSSTIFFYSLREITTDEFDETGNPIIDKRPYFTSAKVFNYSQIEGAPPLDLPPRLDEHNRVPEDVRAAFEYIMEKSGANIVHGFRIAAYAPSEDKIYMPDKERFDSEAHYMTTMLHELCHWTGAQHRLNREFGTSRSSPEYAIEELKAEMGTVFLCAKLGIPYQLDNHSNYIASYLKSLDDDPRMIWRAAKEAETMADYVLSLHPEYRPEIEAARQSRKDDAISAGAPPELFELDELDLNAPEFAPVSPSSP